jgi:hypothetical protein
MMTILIVPFRATSGWNPIMPRSRGAGDGVARMNIALQRTRLARLPLACRAEALREGGNSHRDAVPIEASA